MDDQTEEAGTFKMADPETIKKRRIVKSVRRKRKTLTATPQSSADFPATSNPFAGFSGLAKEEEDKPKSNPFAGFSALTDNDNNTAVDDEPFSVFSTMASQEKEQTPFPSASEPAPLKLSFEKKVEEEDEDSAFVKKRKGLNKSFYKWVCKQFAENKFSDWTIGVQDYITHMKKLKQKRDKNTTTTNGTSSNAAPKIAKDTTTSDGGNDDDDGDEKKVYEQRAKVFKLDTESKQYKQQGLGDLRIMVDKTTNKSRIVLYDACGRLMVNLNLYKGITFNREGKKAVAFVASTADEGPAKYMVRVKNTELADALKEAFEKYTN